MKSPKVFILGWDGATFDLIFKWRDKLPNTSALLNNGSFAYLHSTFPPVTASAWISFVTGTNPGMYGVFDFLQINVKQYMTSSKVVLGSPLIKGNTFLDIVSASGLKVGAIGIPMTYPAWEINGIMISGLPGPDKSEGYAYPDDYTELASALNFKSSYFRLPLYNKDKYVELSLQMIEKRAQAAFELMEHNSFDLFVLVHEAPDRVQHLFWKYMEPQTFKVDDKELEKFHDVILNHYVKLDQMLGRFISEFGKDSNFIIMSDHGFRRFPLKYFHTNYFLKTRGSLKELPRQASPFDLLLKQLVRLYKKFPVAHFKLKDKLPHVLKERASMISKNILNVNWKETKAYRIPLTYPVEGIAINLKGRQPEGCVNAEDYEKLRNEIRDELLEVRDPYDNSQIVEKVLFREEVYSGPYVEWAPDILVVLNREYYPGSGLNSLVSPIPDSERSHWNGLHDMHGILIMHGPVIKRNFRIEKAKIEDLAPTILYLMGIPIPNWMTGKILIDAFDEEFVKLHPPQYTDKWTYKMPAGLVEVESNEQEEMKERLRGLGYMG